MINPWFYVENDSLLAIYRIAVEQKLSKDIIEFVFNEIKLRNLRVDKPRHLKIIK